MERILEVRLEKTKMLEEWPIWTKKVADAAERRLGKIRVYLFGSMAEGRWDGSSDVDLLIISNNLPKTNLERSDLKVELEEEAGLPPIHPLEIHLATKTEAEWYFKHIKRTVELSEE